VESVYRSLQTAQELEAGAPGTPSKRRKSNNGHAADETVLAILPVPADDQVPALIAVVCLMTASSMRGKRAFAVDNAQKRTAQSAVEGYFAKHKTAAAVTIGPTSLQRDIETYMQAAKSWSDMEWYLNIPAAGELDEEPAKTPLRRKEKHSQKKIGDEDVYGPAGLLPGLGTMFQPAVDWLSEDRREDFAAWKQDILNSVEAIEQEA
jgi:origin recognition complex subunit 6